MLKSLRLRLLSALVLMLCGVSETLADTTITFTADLLGGTNNVYELKTGTASGVDFSAYSYQSGSNATCFQFNGSNGKNIFFNTSEMPGVITSLKATKASGTDRSVEVYIGKEALTSSNYTKGTSLGSKAVTESGTIWELTEEQKSEGYRFFYFHYPTTKALFVTQFEVSYYSAPTIPLTISFHAGNGSCGTISLKEESAGAGVTLPSAIPNAACASDGWTFAGWTTEACSQTKIAPTIYLAGSTYKPMANETLYAVYAKTVLGEGETLIETLSYDTWTFSGPTLEKSDYRLFGNGSYIESSVFDLSLLKKVIVYGGTFGGDKYNAISIKDAEDNIWKSGTVTGSSQTGTNTYTGGTALTGEKALRIYSNSGDGTNNGVRISAVEIYGNFTVYYNSNPVCYSLESDAYATFSSSTNTAIPDGMTAYYLSSAVGGTATLKAYTDIIPANQGAVLKNTSGENKTFTMFATETAGEDVANLLAPSTDVTAVDGDYVLANDANGWGFYPLSAGGALPAGKAYLPKANVSSSLCAPMRIVFENEATAISKTFADNKQSTAAYNLAGQKVSEGFRGIIVKNGKKVLK